MIMKNNKSAFFAIAISAMLGMGANRGKRTTNQIQRNGDYTPKGWHKDEY